ncbi:hypothetical protein [Sorangium sp. So ce1000]|uniref:hypothetical protein n=1 Tax=Sorangium sp. So ce1000 TaxID=3133325 RepID=UPI003F5EB8A6
MPIALLLQETTAAFRFGARVLDPWTYLVRLEELLIDRARGAFLVHWFGERIPLHGSQVRVVITNLDALRNRYLAVKRQFEEAERGARGPNLTEPLFGLAGLVAGLLITPGVALGSAIAVLRKVRLSWWQVILVAVGGVLAPVVAGLSPLLAGAGFAGETLLGITNDPSARAVYDLLGETAKLLISTRKFIDLLLGPIDAVQNPILKGILLFVDQVAKLFPFALALIAVVVTRIGPLLLPLVEQLGAFKSLVVGAIDAISFIVGDLVASLQGLFTGPTSIVSALKRVLVLLKSPIRPALGVIRGFFKDARKVVSAWYTDVNTQLESYQKTAPRQLANAIQLIPGVMNVGRIIKVFEIVGVLFESATAGPSSPSSGPPSALDKWLDQAEDFGSDAAAAFRSFPALPSVETPTEMVERLGLVEAYGIPSDVAAYKELIKGTLPPVSAEVQKYIDRARRPASAFAFERKALTLELGAEPKDALAAARNSELELRRLVEAVVGRVFPPKLRALAPTLAEAFGGMDEAFNLDTKKTGKEDKKKDKTPFPVKELPRDNGLLAPVVGRLVVRSETGSRDDLYDFMVRLQKKLDRPYPAPT